MTTSPCDYLDDLNRTLGIHLNTDDVALVIDAALAEVRRLQSIEKLLRDNLDRITAALITMQDSDHELGHPEEAKASSDLIDKLKALPDPAGPETDDEEEDEDDGDE